MVNNYADIKTLEDAIIVIAEQDRMIGKLTRENLDKIDTIYLFKECTRKRKIEAGYHDSVSFDVVWEETLKRSKLYDESNTLIGEKVIWDDVEYTIVRKTPLNFVQINDVDSSVISLDWDSVTLIK